MAIISSISEALYGAIAGIGAGGSAGGAGAGIGAGVGGAAAGGTAAGAGAAGAGVGAAGAGLGAAGQIAIDAGGAIASSTPTLGGLFTANNLATAASIASASAAVIEATKGVPSPAIPKPPPSTPTIADARIAGVDSAAKQRAAAAAGVVAGFSDTVKNKGGAQGLSFGGSSRAPLAKASLF